MQCLLMIYGDEAAEAAASEADDAALMAARGAYARAIGLERDPAVRAFLQQRRGAVAG